MSEASKKFWQDQISRKGEIVVPDLLDDWAAVVTQDIRDESDKYFTECQQLTAANRDLDAMLKQQVEENARLVDVAQAVKNENERMRIAVMDCFQRGWLPTDELNLIVSPASTTTDGDKTQPILITWEVAHKIWDFIGRSEATKTTEPIKEIYRMLEIKLFPSDDQNTNHPTP
jgi:hypothetical protein